MPRLREVTPSCPEETPLKDVFFPLSQHQSQEMQRRSPQSPGLWVRASLTAKETSTAPEVGVEWGAALVDQRQPSLSLFLG